MKPPAYRSFFDELPCAEALAWLKTQPDIQTAWRNCDRGDWMIWALRHGKCLLPKQLWVELAQRCSGVAKHYAAAAANAARDAGNAADFAAAYAADCAADAYAYAARGAADYAAARDAADYSAAAARDAADFAAEVADYAERQQQADWIRERIPEWPIPVNS